MTETKKISNNVAEKISEALAELETGISENDKRITDEMFNCLCASELLSANSRVYWHRTLAALQYAQATLNVFLEE
jgi:hypothetical protein